MIVRGRFAPSPSGRMHLGNVYSAVLSFLSAKSRGGEWILRIEDLDTQRCKREYADILEDDLRWLGLSWDEGGQAGGAHEPYYQSARGELYREALERIRQKGLLYPCYCRRADILAARAPHESDGMVVYSGRCFSLTSEERKALEKERRPAMRIHVPDETSAFEDGHYGLQTCNLSRDCGDFILQRADGSFAYQLAVVVDDALMNVNEVVRGCDLLQSTHQQIFLYKVLGYEAPRFYHLPLLMSASGHRLAKRDAGTDMGYLRQHFTPEALLGRVAYYARLLDREEPISLGELLSIFSWEKIPTENITVD